MCSSKIRFGAKTGAVTCRGVSHRSEKTVENDWKKTAIFKTMPHRASSCVCWGIPPRGLEPLLPD